jgi:putative oxidoreductase
VSKIATISTLPPAESAPGEWMSQVYVVTLSVVVSALFLQSGLAHIQNPYAFLATIHSYQLLEARLGEIAATFIPGLQIVAALGLLSRTFVRSSFLLSTLLFSAFTLAQSTALWRELEIDCGCFGPVASVSVSSTSVGFVAALILLCALGCGLKSDK